MRLQSSQEHFSGGYKVTSPLKLLFSAGYSTANWNFTFNARNPFMESYSKSEYIAEKYSKVAKTYRPRVLDNAFVLGINYRFSYGKKHKFQDAEVDDTYQTGVLDTKVLNK